MSFSNDDLKQLKDKMAESNKSGNYCALEKDIPFLPALLARLEAAEEVIGLLDGECQHTSADNDLYTCAVSAAVIAWKKSCGRQIS